MYSRYPCVSFSCFQIHRERPAHQSDVGRIPLAERSKVREWDVTEQKRASVTGRNCGHGFLSPPWFVLEVAGVRRPEVQIGLDPEICSHQVPSRELAPREGAWDISKVEGQNLTTASGSRFKPLNPATHAAPISVRP